MKDAFYFILKVTFVFKISKFLPSLFGHAKKPPALSGYFKIYDVETWLTNN